jgi:hypothetical protein
MPTPKCVNDYDQIRQLAPPPSAPGIHPAPCEYLFVAGLPVPENSGLQGFFEWRSNSTADDNGGTVIKPNAVSAQSKGRCIACLMSLSRRVGLARKAMATPTRTPGYPENPENCRLTGGANGIRTLRRLRSSSSAASRIVRREQTGLQTEKYSSRACERSSARAIVSRGRILDDAAGLESFRRTGERAV